DVDDGARHALQRLESALDEILPGLGYHLDGDVAGDGVGLDQLAHVVVIDLRGRREAHLDFLETGAYQQIEEAPLALQTHGIDQRLVAVAHVHAAPDRRVPLNAVGPLAVRQLDGLEGAVFAGRVLQHHFGSPAIRGASPAGDSALS